jgi:hypothetical protein
VSSAPSRPEGLLWATRGLSWGFRFLLDGGASDPLGLYERHFADLGDDRTAFRRTGGAVALRFPDPQGRRDASGRLLLHEFVLSGDLAVGVGSVEDGLRAVWPKVAGAYARVWDATTPPAPADLRFNDEEPDASR